MDVPLLRGRVPLLNNSHDPLAGSNDASVTVRGINDRGQHGSGRAPGMVTIDQPAKRRRRQKRNVARKEDGGSARALQGRLGDEQRVARPELGFLDDKAEIWMTDER